MEGWIKLHRKSLDSEVFRDQVAWVIFCWLLLRVNRETGTTTLGRFWASKELKLKPTTFYQALKRLEKKYKMISLMTKKVTIKYTEVRVLNWAKYQSKDKQIDNSNDNPMTIQRQSNDTLQEVENKRIKNITKVIVKTDKRNPLINDLTSYFLQKMSIPKEDCTQRQSRQYWYLLLKESKKGIDGVKWLIDLASQDEFYKNNISSSKDLYYKRVKIIARKRGERPKFAVMPTGGDKNE